jgi:NAD(P)H dehydrogenase (quinone)
VIAITGASGGVGSRVARRLADRGERLRLVVRDPERAPDLPGAEVRQASSYGDGEAMRAALEGAATVFLIPAAESADRIEQHVTAVEAAAAAGAERIAYLSYVGAHPGASFSLARHHWATEEAVRATDVPFTFLRMSLFTDYITFMASADGVIAGPAADGRIGAVTRDDVADVAAAVLPEPGHEGASYDLTGPEAFTLEEAAAEMSRASGKQIVFKNETVEEAYASRAHYGAPDWEVEGWVTSYQSVAAGEAELVTGEVERLAGHRPMSLAQFLGAYPHALDHVTDT